MTGRQTTSGRRRNLAEDDEMAVEPPRTRSERLLASIRREFPDFEVRRKKGDRIQHAISLALAIMTLGGQRSYLTRYHTVLFGKLYVPDSYAQLDDVARTILLEHERVHLLQRRRMGDLAMAFIYLVPVFPLFLAWGRARLEWEAYTATMRATAELCGLPAARALENELVRRFVGPDYGWMWPFPRTIRRWFRAVLAELEATPLPLHNSDPHRT